MALRGLASKFGIGNVLGFGFRDPGFETWWFRVSGSGCAPAEQLVRDVAGSGSGACCVYGMGIRVSRFELRDSGVGIRVQDQRS